VIIRHRKLSVEERWEKELPFSQENEPDPKAEKRMERDRDLESIRLNKSERIVLRYIAKHEVVVEEELHRLLRKEKNKSAPFNLTIKQLVCSYINRNNERLYRIIKRGENWLEFYDADWYKRKTPTIIQWVFSALAIILSVVSTVISVIALLQSR